MNIAAAPVMLPAPPWARVAVEGDLAGGMGSRLAHLVPAKSTSPIQSWLGWLLTTQETQE